MPRLTRRDDSLAAADVRTLAVEDIESLARDVFDPGREHPIVALSTRPGERAPALDPSAVRRIVGPDVPIVLIVDGPVSRGLQEHLGQALRVFGGAVRVWWPGASPASDGHDHPLLHDPHGVYGRQTLERFARRWAKGPPALPGARVVAQRESEAVHWRTRAVALEQELAELRAALADARAERDRAQARARAAERAEPTAATAAPARGLDPEAAFHVAVATAWAQALTPDDRRAHPLGPLVLGERFLASLDERPDIDRERVAWVCAMVGCARAPQLDGLELHALRTAEAGNAPQRSRDDGARAWRVALKRSSPAAPRLHYWSRPDGVVELAGVCRHDEPPVL